MSSYVPLVPVSHRDLVKRPDPEGATKANSTNLEGFSSRANTSRWPSCNRKIHSTHSIGVLLSRGSVASMRNRRLSRAVRLSNPVCFSWAVVRDCL